MRSRSDASLRDALTPICFSWVLKDQVALGERLLAVPRKLLRVVAPDTIGQYDPERVSSYPV